MIYWKQDVRCFLLTAWPHFLSLLCFLICTHSSSHTHHVSFHQKLRQTAGKPWHPDTTILFSQTGNQNKSFFSCLLSDACEQFSNRKLVLESGALVRITSAAWFVRPLAKVFAWWIWKRVELQAREASQILAHSEEKSDCLPDQHQRGERPHQWLTQTYPPHTAKGTVHTAVHSLSLTIAKLVRGSVVSFWDAI